MMLLMSSEYFYVIYTAIVRVIDIYEVYVILYVC
jgi:hypothetical protein